MRRIVFLALLAMLTAAPAFASPPSQWLTCQGGDCVPEPDGCGSAVNVNRMDVNAYVDQLQAGAYSNDCANDEVMVNPYDMQAYNAYRPRYTHNPQLIPH